MNHGAIRVACLQVEAKSFQQEEENKKNILEFIHRAARAKPDLMVLPECVYPCYFLSPRIIQSLTVLSLLTASFLEEIKACAKKYHTFIAIGLPEYIQENNNLFNSAFLIDDEGKIIGHTRKSFLWHFDNHWFKGNHKYPVFETKIGKIGLFVCADGRLPEIIRCLALQGAEILLDLTNWVTSGLNQKTWSNPQAEYMIPTRALENRVWIVAANKVGMEEKTIQYCGKSAFFSPEGEILAMASTDQEEIITREIELTRSHQKEIHGAIDVFRDRQPETYKMLTVPSSEIPVSQNIIPIGKKMLLNPLSAVIQIEANPNLQSYLKKMEYFFHTLKEQEVNIYSFSQNNRIPAQENATIIDSLKNLTKNTSTLCSIVLNEQEGTKKYKTIFLIESGEISGQYRKTHLEFQEKIRMNPGKPDYEVFETQFGSIGMMLDYEGFFPEIARILTLKGAEIIIWPTQFSGDEQLKIARTRSAENKIFIICPNSIQQPGNGHSVITAPSGQQMTACLENLEMASMAKIAIYQTNDKIIVPHTHAILGRRPESYNLLVTQKEFGHS